MKKILFGLGLFLLIGCANYSLSTPFVDKENSDGGVIWSHSTFSNSSPSNIQIIANTNCSNRGFNYANIKQIGVGGLYSGSEFNKYEFICNKGNKPDQIDSAKDICTRIGFKVGTIEHSNCTLELVKKQSQPGNNTIVIQNDGNSSQELMNRGLDMLKGSSGSPSINTTIRQNCTTMIISRNPYTTKEVCR